MPAGTGHRAIELNDEKELEAWFKGELGANLLKQNKPVDAESILRECLTVLQQNQPEARTTFHTQSLLGAALLGQQKYDEAEPLLRQGYQGLKQRGAPLPEGPEDRLTEALERLVQLYDTWGKEAEAAKWRQELEAEKARQKKRKP